jgi:hypothetical protein
MKNFFFTVPPTAKQEVDTSSIGRMKRGEEEGVVCVCVCVEKNIALLHNSLHRQSILKFTHKIAKEVYHSPSKQFFFDAHQTNNTTK